MKQLTFADYISVTTALSPSALSSPVAIDGVDDSAREDRASSRKKRPTRTLKVFDGDPDLSSYDIFIVAFSGGKDSQALVLDLLERGVPRDRIELWHHDVDGREDGNNLMDWPVTREYCRRFAEALGLTIYFSWRQGGFKRELLKENDRLAGVSFETPDGLKSAGGVTGSISTRRMFPQLTAKLAQRWCSSVLKIDVMATAINNQARFHGKRILVLTGERAEESAARAHYNRYEEHRCTTVEGGRLQRIVHVWRSVHSWSAAQVWAIIRRWGILAHPAYRIGFGRVSCMKCIFLSNNQWATVGVIDPSGFGEIVSLESSFGKTIRRDQPVTECAARGVAYQADPALVALALSHTYDAPILVDPTEWTMPAGAFGESDGPC